MRTIQVRRTLAAPIDRVFDVISDHAGYVNFQGVRASTVTKPGTTEPNGLGAQREVDLGVAWVREEITRFERPTRMDYRIIKSKPRMEHELGSVELVAVAGGTDVTWTTRFRVRIPVIGGLVTAIAARRMKRLLGVALANVEQRAAAAAA